MYFVLQCKNAVNTAIPAFLQVATIMYVSTVALTAGKM